MYFENCTLQTIVYETKWCGVYMVCSDGTSTKNSTNININKKITVVIIPIVVGVF